jgi:hypothetical protein
MPRPTLPAYPSDGPWSMTTLRIPCWLRDAISDPASRTSVEPWVILSHWLSADGRVPSPPAPHPQALRLRYGGHFGPEGMLTEERFALAGEATPQRGLKRGPKRRVSIGRARLAREAAEERK